MNDRVKQHLDVIKENAVDIISEEEIISKLENSFKTNQPLKLKVGFDPTSRDIHLGHTVLLRKLRKLQNLGHQVYFIIGDFTAKIGDPSGKTALRPVLNDEEIKDNASTYIDQASKILDKNKTKVIYNSIWYKDMVAADFLSLLSSYTVARILERDDFSQRIKENKPLTLLEIIYPLIQGYDSYKLSADIEFGGTDQKFNLIVGRHLQQVYGQIPQAIITMPILVGLDGKNKMSKSLNNYIGVFECPKDMFGKLMSISDEIMWEYFKFFSDQDIDEAKNMHPKQAKILLAQELVSFYHSQELAQQEREEFERVFSKGKLPEEILLYEINESPIDLIDVLFKSKIVSSKNDVRRLISQGAISCLTVEDCTVATVVKESIVVIPCEGVVFKIGKKRFLKVSFKEKI